LITLTLSLAFMAGCAQGAPSASQAIAPFDAAAFAHKAKSSAMDAWRDDNIYFVMTDRFADGDKSNDFNVDLKNPSAYHGGDFQGIIDHLAYIKQLGATALWITPVNDNKDDALAGQYWAYHGYWIKDFNAVDEHLGSIAKLHELVQKAHAMGIKVLLDIVCNHMGYQAPLASDPRYTNWFHHNGNITDWNNQFQLENFDVAGLPDLNTENPQVISYLENVWSGWIDKSGVDGFRIDTVKHVPIAFWSQFNGFIHAKAGSGFLLLGEVLQGDPNYDAPYQRQGGFDSLFDYPMYYTFQSVFAQGGSMKQLGDRLRQDASYQDAPMLSPFLDNHDVPRFLTTANGDESKLRLALAFLYTMRGIPSLYYGTECGVQGGADPDNRKDMPFGADPSLTRYTSQLLHLRTELAPLRRGAMLEMWQDDQVYGFSRLLGKQEAICLFNNDTHPQTRTIPLHQESALSNGQVLVNRLGNDTLSINNRQLTVTLNPKEAKIYIPAPPR
jgi:alpha-amylase